MGSNRKLLFGGLLVVAALVFWGLLSAISRWNGGGQKVAPTRAPLVAGSPGAVPSGASTAYATVNIPAGSIVTKEMMEMRPSKTGTAPTGFVTDPANQAVGYITRVPISKGTAFRPGEDFIGHISEVGIAGALGVGKRAMVIPFANKPTLHDLVRIGNFIDVNAAFDGQEARTIVQNVRVLAVDVFGNDFPQVNIAVRGPYRAAEKGSEGAPITPGATNRDGSAVAPGAAPTATPAPAQAPPRPDPAITLEVTPAQANTILLAQASGGTLDFVVRPALPGGVSADPTFVEGQGGLNGGTTTGGTTTGGAFDGDNVRSVSITKAQIAPYAERHKTAGSGTRVASSNSGGSGGNSGSNRGSGSGGGQGSGRIRPVRNPFGAPPDFRGGGATSGGDGISVAPTGIGASVAPALVPPSPTYDIPIYADGKTVRLETVRRPQDPPAE